MFQDELLPSPHGSAYTTSGSNKPPKNWLPAKDDYWYYRKLSQWTHLCCPYKPYQKPSDYGLLWILKTRYEYAKPSHEYTKSSNEYCFSSSVSSWLLFWARKRVLCSQFSHFVYYYPCSQSTTTMVTSYHILHVIRSASDDSCGGGLGMRVVYYHFTIRPEKWRFALPLMGVQRYGTSNTVMQLQYTTQ